MQRIGVIVIGRNEGDRLIRCLNSVAESGRLIVYVDSGSTDDSVSNARKLGVEVVQLDMDRPFTAARARNAGFNRLMELDEALPFVQFVDGDCTIDPDWFVKAFAAFSGNPDVAVVCGRRRERYPEASVYNYLCDVEWNTPIGPAKACGGDFLVRTEIFRRVAGFDGSLIAGEEPELCVRIRQAGFGVLRIDAEMSGHDANITKFSQWWKRNVRAGHAYAEGMAMYGRSPERFRVKECRRIFLWALCIPLLTLALMPFTSYFLFILLAYPLQVCRVAYQRRDLGMRSLQYAFFNVLGKFPELQGMLIFQLNKLKNNKAGLIEYK